MKFYRVQNRQDLQQAFPSSAIQIWYGNYWSSPTYQNNIVQCSTKNDHCSTSRSRTNTFVQT